MKTKVLALAFLLLAGLTLPALADGKIYPGSMGVRWNSTDPVPALAWSGLFNPSPTKSLRVDLPIVRDVINGKIQSGWVKAIDQHPTLGVRMQLASVYRSCNGFLGWFSPNQFTFGASKCAQQRNYGPLGSNSMAHYYYSCTIPRSFLGRRSGIVSYSATEKINTPILLPNPIIRAN